MEFEDILKILAVIAVFIGSSFFDSKKKKAKREEAKRKAEAQHTLEYENETQAPATTQQSSGSFFDEVKRMLEEAEQEKKQEPLQQDIVRGEAVNKREYDYDLSAVDEDYFEEEYEEEEQKHFPVEMPDAQEEALAQTEISDMGNEAPKRKPKINLKKAIVHQIILERKYS